MDGLNALAGSMLSTTRASNSLTRPTTSPSGALDGGLPASFDFTHNASARFRPPYAFDGLRRARPLEAPLVVLSLRYWEQRQFLFREAAALVVAHIRAG